MGWFKEALQGVATIGGAVLGVDAAKDATAEANKGAAASLNYLTESRDLGIALNTPYRQAGYTALSGLMDMVGLNQPAPTAAPGAPAAPTGDGTPGSQPGIRPTPLNNIREGRVYMAKPEAFGRVGNSSKKKGGAASTFEGTDQQWIDFQNLYYDDRKEWTKQRKALDQFIDISAEGKRTKSRYDVFNFDQYLGGKSPASSAESGADTRFIGQGGQLVATGQKGSQQELGERYGIPGLAGATGTAGTPDSPGTTAPAAAPYQWQTDPGYQFRMDQQLKAIENSAFARGGGVSGGTAFALQQQSGNLASTEYGNVFNRLALIAGYGTGAVNSSVNTVNNAGANMANVSQSAGGTRASGQMQQGNYWANAINQLGTQAGSYQAPYDGTQDYLTAANLAGVHNPQMPG